MPDFEIPTSNPDAGKPTRKQKPKTRIVAGSDLVPNLETLKTGSLTRYAYWVGISPSCPVENIVLGGINFPKVAERIVDDPMRTAQKRRVPVIGSLVWLSIEQIDKIREALSRTVIRFYPDGGQKEEPGTGQNVGDNHIRPRRGQVITIPSAEQVEEAQKSGRAIRRYIASERDVPAARFLFAQLCADQKNGNRGDFYPDPLETTGLDYPE